MQRGHQLSATSTKSDFSADCQQLNSAMKRIGTNDDEIIKVASQHNYVEREQISNTFSAEFGQDLLEQLRNELSGNYRELIAGLFTNRHRYWARAVREAIKGTGTHERNLIQLILLMGDADAPLVGQCYRDMFQSEILEDIQNDVDGDSDWGRLLRAWLVTQNEHQWIAEEAADLLHQAAAGLGTDEDVFIKILAGSTAGNFQAIAAAFTKKYQEDLREVLKDEFMGDSEFAYLLAHDYLINPMQAVAWCIHGTMHGLGTNDAMLIAVTVLFCDIFKSKIYSAYRPYGNMDEDIMSDLGSNYLTAVLKMWGLK